MNIRQVRKKIKSVTNVKKITKAMQMVSAIKMKKAQEKAIQGKPYQDHLQNIIQRIVKSIETKHSLLLISKKGIPKKDVHIVITTNKGLCGAFNFNLFRFIVKNCNLKTDVFIVIGKKGGNLLSRLGGNILADFSSHYPLENIPAVFELALKNFIFENYTSVSLMYNEFISILDIEPTKEIILPIKLELHQKEKQDTKGEYLFEPGAEKIIDPLLKSYVEGRIRHAIIESEAGEHSSRMMAMKNATENADDVVYNLTLLRNRIRQTKITNELLDMITAKESVEKS